MKILITGATGLIGSQIINDALSQGIEVNFLTTRRIKTVNENKLKGFYWNPENSHIENFECFEKVDTIIHLAGSRIDKRWTKRYKKKILESRIKSLELLFTVIQSKNFTVNHLISASAIGCYPSSESKEFNENEPIKADNFLSKVVNDWELAANKFNSIGIPVSIVRIGLVVSAKGGFLERQLNLCFILKLLLFLETESNFNHGYILKMFQQYFYLFQRINYSEILMQ